ncbi:MAG: hypothetical protein JW765_02375, partial [Deltaproteobacteria bacterium]|nr:hypothetical protein [Candidatus Zymogenaceae bacterium]
TVVNTIDVPAPFVTGPDLISDSTPTWNWTSGTLGSGIPETDTTYDVQINDTAEMGWIPLGTTTLTYTAPSSLSDGEYTLFVRETYLTNEPKIGSKTTMVDTTGPAKPIGMGPYALLPAGLETAENDRWATPDSTPGWRWQSGGSPDAIGTYGYRLMAGATELTSGTTTATTFLYTTALAEGVYTFYVKEFDQAGNPSPESSYRITVDWTPPVFNSVVAEGGAVYTNQTTINAALDFATETTPLTMCYYDYTVSKWTEWEPASTPKSIPAVAGNGERYAYFGLRDEAGNETYRWDLIILDQTAPTVSFVINNGDAYTPSTRCYLNITANDSYPNQSVLQVRQRYGGYEGPWQAYATSILSSFSFTNDAGSKTVYLDVRDVAGNVTTVSDTITLQLANPNYSWKGYNSIGSVRTYFNEVADPTGSYVTRYYVYYTADPNADPNGGSPMNGLGYVTNTYYYDGSVPTGQTYWFYVRVYNADTGGWGPFSSVGTLGYSSDIAIVYDDEDLDEATYLKNILTDYYSLETALYVEGKMPRWTVTLLHENYISNTYSSSNRIYGAPVILMPGISTFILDEKAGVIYQNTGRIRNIVTNGQGIVALGPGGAAALDIIADNASSWGISDPPTYIGLDESRTDTTDSTTLTTIWPATPDNVWQFPLYYTKLAAPGAPAIFWKYPADGAHGALYFYKGIPPSGVDLKIFAAALEPRDFYPIVRQGRFLYYGYFKLPIYPVGMVFTVNMVYRMSLW